MRIFRAHLPVEALVAASFEIILMAEISEYRPRMNVIKGKLEAREAKRRAKVTRRRMAQQHAAPIVCYSAKYGDGDRYIISALAIQA